MQTNFILGNTLYPVIIYYQEMENMYMFRTLSSLSGIPQGNNAIIFWHKLHSQQLLNNNKTILEHVMSHKFPVCSHTYNNSVL